MKRKSYIKRHNALEIVLNDDGTTMVETLVAFVVLMIILAIIYSAVSFCYNLRMKTADTDRVMQQFNAELYKSEDKIDLTEVSFNSYNMQDGKGPVFYLMLDYENSDMITNNVKDSATEYSDLKIRMNKLEATGYQSVNPLIESEELATPKALRFRYKE
ncbi:MAG: hypothetical protein K6B68_08970 [Eubacterium sp.]|nr:hypothetical protein [Eubacterium sp.]